jgi:hypothetical protein
MGKKFEALLDFRAGDLVAKERHKARVDLDGLKRQFADFRRKHSTGARIPEALRKQVFAALRAGATYAQLNDACRVSWSQIAKWKSCQRGRPASTGSGLRAARVFSVVEDVEPQRVEPAVENPAQGLELRTGTWAISIRQWGR